jgi:PAS domain S-box-containing protein
MVHHAIFVRRENESIHGLADLRNSLVLVQDGDIMHDYVVNQGLTDRVRTTAGPAAALTLLANGVGDCALLAQEQALYLIAQLGLTTVRIAGPPFLTTPFCFAVRQGNTGLVEQLNRALDTVKRSRDYDRIHRKWFTAGTGAPRWSRRWPRTVTVLLLVVAAAAVAGVVCHRAVVRTVSRRTAALEHEIAVQRETCRSLRRECSDTGQLLEACPAGLVVVNSVGQITFANEAAETFLGIDRSKIRERSYNDLLWNITSADGTPVPDAELPFRRVLRERTAQFDLRHAVERPDGTRIQLSIDAAPLTNGEDGSMGGMVAAFRDITQTVRLHRELARTNRLLRVVSECRHEIIRAGTVPAELMQAVCERLVEAGGYRLAWIGLAEADERHSVSVAAAAGPERAYLDHVAVTWDDTPSGRGPTGTAIRTGEAVTCGNVQTDQGYEIWREAAAAHGFEASAALPLRGGDGRVIGAVNLYAGRTDAFDARELSLLTPLADDLAFVISGLRPQP